jgi:hypothetical protein
MIPVADYFRHGFCNSEEKVSGRAGLITPEAEEGLLYD